MAEESKVESVFCSALERNSIADRISYLNEVCANDIDLRNRVCLLLAAQPNLGNFLEIQAVSIAGDATTAETIGTQLGPYKLLHQLGRGGMGVVYEAEQVSLGRRVALKILPFAALLNETQLERFATEAWAAAALQHEHIVPIYSVGCERGIHFYAMQLIDGPSLAQVIAELRQEPPADSNAAAEDQPENADTIVAGKADLLTREEDGGHYRAVARIGREAAEALHYAHENGVLHRDIKPSNLLLDKSGHLWIADFGLARVEDESQLTRTGDILGTLRYMSPEQAAGDRVDARSDVYSLGATLYELATLQPVFESEDGRDVIKRLIAGNVIPPHHVDSRIPPPLSYVIGKSMARLDERYQSAQEVADDLRRFLDGEAVTAQPPSQLRRARTWSRRHRMASALIVGLLVLVLLLPFTTHYFLQRGFKDSQTKGDDMKVSNTAKVAAAVASVAIVASGLTAKKPPNPPPEPGLTVSWEVWGADVDLESVGSLVWEGGLVQQPDGKFLNVGTFMGHDPWLAQVTRWNIDGSVDTTFNNTTSTAVGNRPGRIVFDVGSTVGLDNAWDVAVQPDGKIVMVGSSDEWSSPWIVRLNSDGSFDTDFGLAGTGIVDYILDNDNAKFDTVALLSDGSIVAAGRIQDNPMSSLLVKFTPDGHVDPTFGTMGYSVVNLGQQSVVLRGNGFMELPDGRLVAPGSARDFAKSTVYMFNADGSLDTSFGNNGLAEVDIQVGGAEFFHSLAVQPDGKIVAVGGTSSDPNSIVVYHGDARPVKRFSIARFNADGSLDNRQFAKPRGYQHLDLAIGGEGEFSDVHLLSDGRIVAVGEGAPGDTSFEGSWCFDIYMARFQANGSLDTSFDGDGWISMHVSDHARGAGLLAIDDHHYLIGAAGVDFEAWSWSTLLVLVSEE